MDVALQQYTSMIYKLTIISFSFNTPIDDCHYIWYNRLYQCKKLGKIFTGPMYKLLLSFMVISDVYRSFIPN